MTVTLLILYLSALYDVALTLLISCPILSDEDIAAGERCFKLFLFLVAKRVSLEIQSFEGGQIAENSRFGKRQPIVCQT